MEYGKAIPVYRWLPVEGSRLFCSLFLILLTALLVVEAVLSVGWRMEHDTPLLHYAAFLIDQYHYVPYRDIFETSMPGTFLFHLTIGKLFGYDDLAFRAVDVAWLAALLATTWAIMRRFGRYAAWASVLLFGLSYFQRGPSMSLQRDYVALLPIAAALLVALEGPYRRMTWSAASIGFLFGLSATVKPHLLVGLPLILLFLGRQKAEKLALSPPRYWLKLLFFSGVGLSLPIIGAGLWLYFQGGLLAFLEMTSLYLPLHLNLSRTHQTIAGWARLAYLVENHQKLGGLGLWLIPAALGVYLALFEARFSPKQKGGILLLVGLAVVYSFYPAISGQFFLYHWMPFQYFITVLSGLVLVTPPERQSNFKQWFPVFLLIATLYLTVDLPPGFSGQLQGAPPPAPKSGRVDEITHYLQQQAKPGDRMQALDWTGGAVHAMLQTRAPLATSFLYDYHFYHHVSTPHIQTLRQRFIDQLKQNPPQFVIEITSDKPWVSGADTTREFDELRTLLQGDYGIATTGDGYLIYELR